VFSNFCREFLVLFEIGTTNTVGRQDRETLAAHRPGGDHGAQGFYQQEARMTFGPSETEPSELRGGEVQASLAPRNQVTFSRRELDRILGLYGRKVAAGEWRDYAIDFLKDRAVFSVFRRSSEMPIYRIEKNPKLARRQGAYSVVSVTGLIIKRGHELERVLHVLDRSLSLVVN
jgi:Protein of unknown function (DUF2794)